MESPPVFSSDHANGIYYQAASLLVEAQEQSSRAGSTREVLHAVVHLRDPRQRWITTRVPAMNPAFALAEVLWILLGRNDSRFVTFFNTQLPRFAGAGRTFSGAYGHRLRRAYGIDQLERAASALRHNAESRQVVLRIWDSALDLPNMAGVPAHEDVPCNIVSLLKVRAGALHWTQIIRSNDILLGLPHNLVQFTSLQEVMAGWIGVEVGTYTQLSDSLHVYEADLKHLRHLSNDPPPHNTDRINLPQAESEDAIARLGEMVDLLCADTIIERSFHRIRRELSLPRALLNWRSILSAEIARRRGWPDAAEEAIAECDNPVLRVLWINWCARLSRVPVASDSF